MPQFQPAELAAADAGVVGVAGVGVGAAVPAGRVRGRRRDGRRFRRHGRGLPEDRRVVRHEAVALALNGLNPPIALHFPGIWWVLTTPGGIKLSVLVRQIESISIGHVEHDSGDVAPNRLRRLDPAEAGIDLEIAAPELALFAGDHAPAEIAALAVDLADRWNEIL